MKKQTRLSEVEKGQLRILYDKGYRFLARDEYGVCAYRNKPRICISKNENIRFRCWALQGQDESVVFLHNDYFLKVGFEDTQPHKIGPNGTLTLVKVRV